MKTFDITLESQKRRKILQKQCKEYKNRFEGKSFALRNPTANGYRDGSITSRITLYSVEKIAVYCYDYDTWRETSTADNSLAYLSAYVGVVGTRLDIDENTKNNNGVHVTYLKGYKCVTLDPTNTGLVEITNELFNKLHNSVVRATRATELDEIKDILNITLDNFNSSITLASACVGSESN